MGDGEAPNVYETEDATWSWCQDGRVYVGCEHATPPIFPVSHPCSLELALLMVQDTTPGLEWPVEVFTQSEYEASVWLKGMESSYPRMLYLEPTQPVATLHVWPIPQHAYTLYVLPWTAHAPYEGWDHAHKLAERISKSR